MASELATFFKVLKGGNGSFLIEDQDSYLGRKTVIVNVNRGKWAGTCSKAQIFLAEKQMQVVERPELSDYRVKIEIS